MTKADLNENAINILEAATNCESAHDQRADNYSNMILDRHDCKCLKMSVKEATSIAKNLELLGLVEICPADGQIGPIVYLTDAGIDLIFAKDESDVSPEDQIAELNKTIEDQAAEIARLTSFIQNIKSFEV